MIEMLLLVFYFYVWCVYFLLQWRQAEEDIEGRGAAACVLIKNSSLLLAR